jgi:hypothetical protein
MPTDATSHPPVPDRLAIVQARLGRAFIAVSALTDAVDVLPDDEAALLRPSAAAASGSLTEAEDVLTHLAAGGGVM